MQVTVTFRHMDSSEALRQYAVEKSDRLSKYLFEPVDIHWILSVEKIRHIADVTVNANGVAIKAQAGTGGMYSAIDGAIDKVEKQVRKHKEKVKDHKPHSAEPEGKRMPNPAAEPAGARRSRIVKKENQFVKPMSVEEAAEQMNLSANPFLVFTDSATSNINVIYRTGDGDYGLIETRTK
ncbi:MAG: ribosome-associated translation inhibitor RaiA [Deltaproteobacteria bacterium]|nr:ribosome-associated translation inhibitor RaiA [Deltaproteobacteria bacterium]